MDLKERHFYLLPVKMYCRNDLQAGCKTAVCLCQVW